MIVGGYGSGKTEVAVNLAIQLADSGHAVKIADLDIVNPYFRCREARVLMERHGIGVVVPPGSQTWADLPIIMPEVRGMLHPPEGQVSIFDVGGDPVGARLLSSFVDSLAGADYYLWQVVNSRRPFNETVEGCLAMQTDIEEASRLRVSALIANSHLIAETTADVILEGYRLVAEVARRNGLPVVFATAMGELADSPSLAEIDVPVLRLERYMTPPWIARAGDAGRPVESPVGQEESGGPQAGSVRTPDPSSAPLPAARSVPLGRRTGVA